jgi:hypothetical protein
VSSTAFAQQPTTAEINEATKRLKAEQAAAEKIATEKALAAQKASTDAKSTATPRKQYQNVNMKIEFTLTDQRGAAAPVKRTVSIIVADGSAGQIRSQAEITSIGAVPLNVDVSPEIISEAKIRLNFGLVYDWPAPVESPAPTQRGTVLKTTMNDRVALILENGKPMVAAQSADPIGDRTVTVEVKATILK